MAEKQPSLIDINTASRAELISVSGIGDNLAQRIIKNRPYSELHDLVNVSGISEKKLAALLPYLQISHAQKIARSGKPTSPDKPSGKKPFTKLGDTEAFIFLEDRNERQDAFLIIFGGFILGLIILLLRRSD